MNYQWYNISADGGRTWTRQMLSAEEADMHKAMGWIVTKKTMF